MQIKLKSCVIGFINKLDNLCLQNDLKYEKNSQLLLKKFPRKSQTFYLSARKSDGRSLLVITRQNCKRWQLYLS